jgi:O-antigen ligase
MIYFISLICLLLPSYLIRFSIFGVPTTLLEILIYIVAIITLLQFLISNFKFSNKFPNPKTKNLIYIPVVLFIIAGIISVIIAPDKKEALGIFKAYIFDPIIFFLVILSNVRKKEDFNWIIKALIVSGGLVAIQAIWQKITGNVTIDGRVVGIFGYSPNYLALFLSPLAVLTFGYGILVSKKILLYIFPLSLMLVAIWLSGSRAGSFAILVGILSFFIINYWPVIKTKKLFILLLYIFVALSFFGGWQAVKPDWQADANSGRVSSSNNIRWEIWKTTTEDILTRNNKWIIGVGLGNYQNYFTNLTKDRVNYPEWIAPMALTPHNLFLTIWVNMGLLGIVAFVWILINFFEAIYYKPYTINNKRLKTYSLCLMTAMIAILVQGLVDTPYWKNDLAVMFWIFIAISIATTSKNIQYENKTK